MAEILMRKIDFAKRCGVTPAAVSQWISRGKLGPPALRRDGTIDVALADQQLGLRLEIARHVSHGGGLLSGRPPAAAPAAIEDLDGARALAKAKTTLAEIAAEKARRELELQRGRYCMTADANARFAQVLREFVDGVDQSIPDLALKINLDSQQAAEMRRWWREMRRAASERNRMAAEALSPYVSDPAVDE